MDAIGFGDAKGAGLTMLRPLFLGDLFRVSRNPVEGFVAGGERLGPGESRLCEFPLPIGALRGLTLAEERVVFGLDEGDGLILPLVERLVAVSLHKEQARADRQTQGEDRNKKRFHRRMPTSAVAPGSQVFSRFAVGAHSSKPTLQIRTPWEKRLGRFAQFVGFALNFRPMDLASTLNIRVLPRAKRTTVERMADGGWKVRLRARAVEGQANAALLEQLAEWLEVSKSAVRLMRGQTSRQKVVAVSGLDAGEAVRRLDAVARGG